MERAHYQAMADLTSRHVPRRESMHTVVMEAFPSARLDNMGLPCGVERFQEKGGREVMGTGMYSAVQYSCFDVVREIALRIMHRLVLECVHDSERACRSTIYVADVRRAFKNMGSPVTLDISDANTLPTCPSTKSIKEGRSAPSQTRKRKQESERQSLIDEQSRMYAEIIAGEAARAPALGDQRGGTRRALISMHQGMPRPHCLYLPVKYIDMLTTWMFDGADDQPPTLTPGAKSLMQFGVEETLMWLIESSWKGVRGYTGRTSITAHDIAVMIDILRRSDERLRGDLPEYHGLDDIERAMLGTHHRADSSKRGRGRGAGGRATDRRGSGQKRRRQADTEESDASSASSRSRTD